MLTIEILLNMYYTFVHCYLNSGIVIWGSTHTNTLDSLSKLQKKAIRLITNSGYRDHTLPHFTRLQILPFQQLYFCNVIIFMYKVYRENLPKIITSCFTFRNSLPLRTTRRSNLFEIPNYTNDIQERSIFGPKNFNLFYRKNSINLTLSVPSFKRALNAAILQNELTSV